MRPIMVEYSPVDGDELGLTDSRVSGSCFARAQLFGAEGGRTTGTMDVQQERVVLLRETWPFLDCT